jgi:hypothetical protein
METVTPNKPKKYEVVEYPEQKVNNLEEKRLESKAVFETLSLEDREKYHEAYADFVQKAKTLGFDRVEDYDIFFNDNTNSLGLYGLYTTNRQTGENYVSLNTDFFSRIEKIDIICLLFHEILGHAIHDKKITKFSNNGYISTHGLNFSKYRESNISLEFEKIKKISNKLSLVSDKVALEREEELILQALKETLGDYSPYILFHTFISHYDELKNQITDNLKRHTKIFKKSKGGMLNEGLTDYFACTFASNNIEEFLKLTMSSGYAGHIAKIVNLKNHLINFNFSDDKSFDQCLLDAQTTGQPYKIIKFLKDKTGISITPKELFDLDFSKILTVAN